VRAQEPERHSPRWSDHPKDSSPVPADAAADLEGLLEHVFGVFGGAADTAGEIVDQDLWARYRASNADGSRFGPGDDRLGVGEEVRVHHRNRVMVD
jgi:hypothetical protein